VQCTSSPPGRTWRSEVAWARKTRARRPAREHQPAARPLAPRFGALAGPAPEAAFADGEGARARRAPDPDVQAGRRVFLDRRTRRRGLQRAARAADPQRQGSAVRLLPLPLPPVGHASRMGADPINALRQMKNTATDPYS